MANWNTNQSSRWKRRFKLMVAIRLGYDSWEKVKCLKCKRKANEKAQRTMEIHHICSTIEYPELRCEVSNVVPLCIHCHDDFHSKYDIRLGRILVKIGDGEDLAKFLSLKAKDYVLVTE